MPTGKAVGASSGLQRLLKYTLVVVVVWMSGGLILMTLLSPAPPQPPQPDEPEPVVEWEAVEVEKPSPYAKIHGLIVVVIAYNRPATLRRTLDALLLANAGSGYRLVVSQDGFDKNVAATAQDFADRGVELRQRQRIPRIEGRKQSGTQWLAQHYGEILAWAFDAQQASAVVLVEDDMVVSRGFLSFFEQLYPVVQADETLWCISTWNDNGFKGMAEDPQQLYRTSFFPGLGWLMPRRIWKEIGSMWPTDHWDHWMRVSTINRGRECIIPEVNRNQNIGSRGTNMRADKFNRFLKDAPMVEEDVHFDDLSYLPLDQYNTWLGRRVENAKFLDVLPLDISTLPLDGTEFLITYRREEYEAKLVRYFQLWPAAPRGHHYGTAVIRKAGRVFILADSRRTPFLPKRLQFRRRTDLHVVAAHPGESCDRACKRSSSMLCDPTQFDFLNECEEVMSVFSCPNGCKMETGKDIPNFVSDEKHGTFGYCLVTETTPTCGASHRSTSRVCPCVPRSEQFPPSETVVMLPTPPKPKQQPQPQQQPKG